MKRKIKLITITREEEKKRDEAREVKIIEANRLAMIIYHSGNPDPDRLLSITDNSRIGYRMEKYSCGFVSEPNY